MAIDPITLEKSKATVAAWAAAVYKGLEDWVHDRPIHEIVDGIKAPTFRKPGPLVGGDPSGCCLDAMPTEPPTIDGLADLIQRIRNLGNYLDLLQKNL